MCYKPIHMLVHKYMLKNNHLITQCCCVDSLIKLYKITCSKSTYDVCNLVKLRVTASSIWMVEYGGVNGPSLKPNFVAMTAFCLRPCRARPNTCSDPAYPYIKTDIWFEGFCSLTSPLVIEVHVPRQESEQSCICMLEVECVSFCDFLLDFRTGIFIFAFHFITRRYL